MGIREGLLLRDYIDNNALKQEEAKLQAQLYGSQAKKYDAENQLLTMKLQQQQQRATDMAPLRTEWLREQQGGMGGSAPSQEMTSTPMPLTPPGPASPGAPPALRPTPSGDELTSFERSMLRQAQREGLDDPQAGSNMMQAVTQSIKLRREGRQQGALEEAGRLHNLYLAAVQAAEADVAAGGKGMDPAIKQGFRGAIAKKLYEGGKISEALKLLDPKELLLTTQAGSSISQVSETGTVNPEPAYQNPQRPITVGEGGQAFQPTGKGPAPAITPPPPPRGDRAEEQGYRSKRGALRAEAEPLPGVPGGPPSGKRRFETSLDGKPLSVDAVDAAQAQNFLRQEFPGRTFQLTEQTPQPGAKAALVGQTTQAQQDTKTGKPGSTQADVTAADEQARNNVAVYGSAKPPEGVPNATAEDVQRTKTMGENLPDSTRQEFRTMLQANRYIKSLQAVPAKEAESYIGFLRKPKAELLSFFQDIETAGKGNAGLYQFLGEARELYYILARSTGGEGGVGANFTLMEKEMLAGVFPDTGVKTYTQFKAALDRLGPVLRDKIDDSIALAKTTRGTVGKDIEERRGAAPSQGEPTTPGKATPPQVDQKIQQMTPAQRLQRIHELEQKKGAK